MLIDLLFKGLYSKLSTAEKELRKKIQKQLCEEQCLSKKCSLLKEEIANLKVIKIVLRREVDELKRELQELGKTKEK